MAINVDKVYQQVSVIMNKEGRGYLTGPEFNILAHKAQMDIFENTFHDYKMALRKPGNHSKFGDEVDMIREKIAEFRSTNSTLSWNGTDGATGTINSNTHWLENVYTGGDFRTVEITFPAPAAIPDDSTVQLRAVYSGLGSRTAGEGWFNIRIDSGSDGSPTDGSNLGAGSIWMPVQSSYTSAQVCGKFIDMINDTSPFHRAERKSGVADNNVAIITYTQSGLVGYEETDGTRTFEKAVDSDGSGSDITFSNAIMTTSSNIFYEEVDKQDWQYLTHGGAKVRPSKNRPIFYRKSKTTLGFYPPLTQDIKHDYISRPSSPKWEGDLGGGNAWGYNSGISENFKLHNSEEGTLVNKILELAGVTIGKPEVTQAAIQNEKLNETDKND